MVVEFCILINVFIVNFEDFVIFMNLFKFCNFNIRLIKNKFVDFVCYVKFCVVDIFVIIEMWFIDMDCVYRVEVILFGYKLYDYFRFGCMGGGIVLMCCEGLIVIKVVVGE